jgi:hypothetical protein
MRGGEGEDGKKRRGEEEKGGRMIFLCAALCNDKTMVNKCYSK